MWQLSKHQNGNYNVWRRAITSGRFLRMWIHGPEREQDRIGKGIKEMKVGKVLMFENVREGKKGTRTKRHEGRLQNSGQLWFIEDVQSSAHLSHLFPSHLFAGKWCLPMNDCAEAWGRLNPSSVGYITSFTIILSFSHFPHTIFPIQCRLEALDEWKAASPSRIQISTLVHIHTHSWIFSSSHLHIFGQWR